jgi:hypothetical protein
MEDGGDIEYRGFSDDGLGKVIEGKLQRVLI